MYTSKTCGTSNITYRYNIVHKSGKDLWREKYVYPSEDWTRQKKGREKKGNKKNNCNCF